MRTVKLGDLPIEWKRGAGLRKSDVNEDGKNKCVLYGELFTKHKSVLIDTEKISKTDNIGSVKSRVGDILVPGTSTATKQDMILARELNQEGVFIGGDVNIIRPKEGLFAQKYLAYFFESACAYRQLERYITGATGIIHISNLGIKNLAVQLPTLEEQKKIVEKLDRVFEKIDQAIELTQKNLANSRNLFNRSQEKYLTPGSGWDVSTFGEVTELKQGLAINAKTKHLLVEKSDLPLLRIKDLRNNHYSQYVDVDKCPESVKVSKDDILYTRTGQVGLVFRGFAGALHNNSFKIIPNSNITNQYLFWYLQSPSFKEKIINLASRTAQPDITHKIFRVQEIDFPKSIDLQLIVANAIENIYDKSQELQNLYTRKISMLEQLKLSMLEESFAGGSGV